MRRRHYHPVMASRRSLSLAALVLVLLAVVALASRGHAPAGGGGTHSINGGLLIEYAALALLAVATVVLIAAVWAVWHNRDRTVVELPARGNWMVRLLVSMIVFSVIAVAYAIYRARHHDATVKPAKPVPGLARPAGPTARKPHAEEQFDWVPAVVVFTTIAGGAAALLVLARRRTRASPGEPDLALQLTAVLDDSLDDLRAESDPRRAVIAAYARMERVLALAGLPRRAAEAPLEYLGRVLRDMLSASAASVARLTALFEWAKFSQHSVDSAMKDEAISALVAVRDELRSAVR
jgi:hypothetical protein